MQNNIFLWKYLLSAQKVAGKIFPKSRHVCYNICCHTHLSCCSCSCSTPVTCPIDASSTSDLCHFVKHILLVEAQCSLLFYAWLPCYDPTLVSWFSLTRSAPACLPPQIWPLDNNLFSAHQILSLIFPLGFVFCSLPPRAWWSLAPLGPQL